MEEEVKEKDGGGGIDRGGSGIGKRGGRGSFG